MSLIHEQSLSLTVDAVNEAAFFGREIAAHERRRTAGWIAGRQGLDGAYAGTFALFEEERREGIRLFTGERATGASARHIIGQEACRALRWLNDRAGAEALARASASLARCVGPAAPRGPKPDDGQMHWLWPYRGGTYCCGRCSVGVWRHLVAGGYDAPETRLRRGMAVLRKCRKGEGQWRVFPFWYTLLALVEMDVPAAVAEMRYAAGRCEGAVKRRGSGDEWSARRAEVARRVLGRICRLHAASSR
jgi:hypothetical protein